LGFVDFAFNAMVIRQIRLEVDVAAKMGEEELVLLVQRDSGAEDAKVKRVARHDEALVAALASGDADEDHGWRCNLV
jgi:hypothetical protein